MYVEKETIIFIILIAIVSFIAILNFMIAKLRKRVDVVETILVEFLDKTAEVYKSLNALRQDYEDAFDIRDIEEPDLDSLSEEDRKQFEENQKIGKMFLDHLKKKSSEEENAEK